MGDVCGSCCPFAVFAVQTPPAHHCVAVTQLLSSVHALPQAPVVVLHWLPEG